MTEKEYISFLLLFLLCLLGTAFKLWDYIRVRRAVKEERARVGAIPGQVVIKVDWRASLSTFCLMLGVLAPLVTGSINRIHKCRACRALLFYPWACMAHYARRRIFYLPQPNWERIYAPLCGCAPHRSDWKEQEEDGWDARRNAR